MSLQKFINFYKYYLKNKSLKMFCNQDNYMRVHLCLAAKFY